MRAKSLREAVVEYKGRIYYRGTEPTKAGQVDIPKWLVKEEESRGEPSDSEGLPGGGKKH